MLQFFIPVFLSCTLGVAAASPSAVPSPPSASASQYDEEVSFRTLSPSDRAKNGGLHVADALLSDWEGDHWVSLDADLDKVALSWKSDEKHITFQVRERFALISRYTEQKSACTRGGRLAVVFSD